MDFLRLHLPGLHQALRGALDSLSTFVAYLIGDAVPTVERETQAAEELGEVAAGKLGKIAEEEAQEAQEDLRGGQSERVGGPREARKCQEGSLAGEQTWEWGACSSARSQAGQDTGDREAAVATRSQEPNAPLDAGMGLEAEPETHGDRSSGAQESQEPHEQEVSRGEPLRTWEQKEEEEEEEEVRAMEPGMARGVESQLTWHGEPEGKAGADGQKVTEDSKETEWVTNEAAAETKRPGVKGANREEERVLMRDVQGARAQGTQGPGEESEDWAMRGREEVQMGSGKEEAHLPAANETEQEPISRGSIPEAAGETWVLEEVCRGDQEEEMCQKRKAERIEEADESQASGREAVGGQEMGVCFESEGRRDLAIRADEGSLEQELQEEKAPRERESCFWATEAVLALDKEVECEPDLEVAPEARPELFIGEKDEEAQLSQEVLEMKVTEGQEPELLGNSQTPTRQPEEDQEEPGRISGLSKEEILQSQKEYPRYMESSGLEVEAWENWKRRERRNVQKGKADAEAGEEGAAADQAVEAQAKGSQEPELPEVPGWGTDEGLASLAVNQELKGMEGAEAVTGQSLGELEATESRASDGEVTDRESGGGWRLEEAALSLQDSEDKQSSSDIVEDKAIPGIRITRAGEGPQWETVLAWEGEVQKSCYSQGREDAWRGTEQEEAVGGENRGGQELDPVEGSAEEEEVTGHSGQAKVGESREEEPAEAVSAMTEGSSEIGDVISDSQAVRAEGVIEMVEAEEGFLGEQMVLEEEAGGEQVREWRYHHREGEAQRLRDVENVMSESQRTEIQETDPEGLEDIPGWEGQPTPQIPAEIMPGPSEAADVAGSATGDARSSWSEALLPGSLLDVSVPRSRVLLSRSSSQRRRSRPSFRRDPEQQYDSPSPQPQEGLSAPEQSPLQPEEAPEPSSPRPEGTPVPARRRLPGHGFGLAHPGMMQELQARLGRPKPQ